MSEPARIVNDSPPPARRPPALRLASAPTSKRRLFVDRAARFVVSLGGVAIIASILGILLFIVAEIRPIFASARVAVERRVTVPGADLGAVISDENRTLVIGLSRDGRVVAVRAGTDPKRGAGNGRVELDRPLATPPVPATATEAPMGGRSLAAALADGRIAIVPVGADVTFEGDRRVTVPRLGEPVLLPMDPGGRPLRAFAAQLGEDGSSIAAAQRADGTLSIVRRVVETNAMTGEATGSLLSAEAKLDRPLATMVFDEEQKNLWAGTSDGGLLWWRLDGATPGEPDLASAGRFPVTALAPLIGGRSLVVGQADGSLSVWFPVEQRRGGPRLTRIHDFPPLPGAVVRIAPSARGKSFLAADARGGLGLYASTSERTLWRGASEVSGTVAGLTFSPKSDGAVLAAGSALVEIGIDDPHPELSWRALFGKVWYEGYPEPAYVWQSSSATDDFEPKLSLVPLLVGTLKGTFYSLLLAIPLGVFGAMFLSQFMHPNFKRFLKPMIEIMAALPSVVLGFLAGLWLAPRVEKAVTAIFLMIAILPLAVLLAGWLWQALPRTVRNRFRSGSETALYALALAAGFALCFALAKPFEQLAFGGSFQSWIHAAFGWTYDQRNAVIVGLAMGFAVIPIIFAIAEDAFSNVPRNLVAGSLALGANRWQTVTRVVLPSASPGIFSAIMIGFGRAVGETMIVLMATGNTPILDWNPFNGFRTLSANIAVEIPEAPQGSTLYRTLFLAALLLFLMTFAVNTIAEVVRQRLRARYSQL